MKSRKFWIFAIFVAYCFASISGLTEHTVDVDFIDSFSEIERGE